ncbi:hypothetical protein [Micromonospora tulbaghiae]|uniref:hypothetical protein n=1 Tax=Micromonospora tulbaghiae TaxID=479978 RepID=UPI003F4DF7A4
MTLTVALILTSAPLTASAASAAVPGSFTVSVDSRSSWTRPDDTPAFPFIDKDGTFYYQQSHSLYGPNDGRSWSFYTGADFDSASRAAISDAGTNPDTTALCNNSPTGVESTYAPSGSGYSQRNFCVLSGVWVDPDTGHWYGLVHNEFTPQPFGDGIHYDGIDYAVSIDQGRTWTIRDHVITSPYSTDRGDNVAFPQQTYHYGDGDQRLYVDAASGYFYAFYGSRIVDKYGGWKAFYGHVARAPMAGKMAPGSWRKWYNGAWSEPGVGGRESTLMPVTATAPTGYVAVDKEYKPTTPGTVDQQVAAGTTPPTSPLFVMDITYNAHLGLYRGRRHHRRRPDHPVDLHRRHQPAVADDPASRRRLHDGLCPQRPPAHRGFPDRRRPGHSAAGHRQHAPAVGDRLTVPAPEEQSSCRPPSRRRQRQ